MLKITLFGTPQITLNGKSLSNLITGRRLALLVYLVASGRPYARDVLADLLWSNTSNRKARKNLRDALPTLRKYLSEYLLSGSDTIAFNRDSYYWLDVEVFRSYMKTDLTTCNPRILQEVLNLYQDDFLDGFYVYRAPVFEEWVLQEREELQTLMVEGLHTLANHYLAKDNYTDGLLITKQLLALEPWREEAHCLQMRLLALSGQRSAGLEQYSICRSILQKEYGIEPLAETTRLYFDIKAGKLVKQKQSTNHSYNKIILKNKHAYKINTIPHSGLLYGRDKQLSELRKWVQQDNYRLITLFGMAGQGKTALAARLTNDLVNMDDKLTNSSNQFESILWYSLANKPTIMQVMRFFLDRLVLSANNEQPNSLAEHFALLVEYLQYKRCLLVLDNFEKIIPNDETKTNADYDMYCELLYWIAENKHQCCLIIISRRLPQELDRLERYNHGVCSLSLPGLSVETGVRMLQQSGLSTDEKLLRNLIVSYSGNPLALTLIEDMLDKLPDNQIEFFFEEEVIFKELHDLLEFDNLSLAERDLLIWLAILEEPIDLKSLWGHLIEPCTKLTYLSAQHSLLRRGLLSDQFGKKRTTTQQGIMRLPKIVRAYVIEHLIGTFTEEIVIYHTTRQALGLTWLENAFSTSMTFVKEQETGLSLLQKINPNDLEQWLIEQGRGLPYLNRYLLHFPSTNSGHTSIYEAIISRLVAKWGNNECAKRLSESLFKLQTQRTEMGYAQTNLRNLLLFFPKTKQMLNAPTHQNLSSRY